MTGTFEIVFSGLCLFLLNGNPSNPSGVDVNLVRTYENATVQCQNEKIALQKHEPLLLIPADGWEVHCSGTPRGKCDFLGDMNCQKIDVKGNKNWACPLEGKDLCIAELNDSAEFPRFETAKGRGSREPVPSKPEYARAFDWIAHLDRIDGDHIADLKAQAKGDASVPNDLITSRIHSSYGELSTLKLGRHRGASRDLPWRVRPNRQPGPRHEHDHPKVLAESMLLQLKQVSGVRLETCLAEGEKEADYWWEFQPRESDKSLRIEVQNRVISRDLPWTVGGDRYPKRLPGGERYPNRLRDFLWFYKLVEWKGGKCPGYLSAPVCPQGYCRKMEKEAKGYHPEGDANHFCPPTTYP